MKSKKKLFIPLTAVFGLLTIATSIGTRIAYYYAPVINMRLGIEASSTTGSENAKDFYKADFKTADEQREDAMKVTEEIVEEGATLLKNDNGALPLAQGGKISLFGQGSVDFIVGGTGSSGTSKSDDTLVSSLEDAGFSVNSTLVDFYTNGNGKNYRRVGLAGALNNVIKDNGTGYINEVPLDQYSDTEWNSVSGSEAIVVVLGRQSGEGGDVPFFGGGDVKNMLELSQEEKDLLGKAKELKDAGAAKKIVVLLNTSNPLELDFLNPEICGTDYGIDAAMWIGLTGYNGITAVGKLLNGSVSPSGRLPDTWCYDNLTSPAMQNTYVTSYTNADEAGLDYSNGGKYNKYYEVYQEGIYVGYKYYETRYEDVVLGKANVGTYDYDSTVAYPFGYGLSYSSFSYQNLRVDEGDENFTVSVDVTNTGSLKAKDAVQVYLQKPYTDYDVANAIEQSAIELAAFDKVELEPAETKTVQISVSKDVLKTYDANGKKTYIREAGNYYFSVGDSSHDALNNVLALKSEDSSLGSSVDVSKMVGTGESSLAKSISYDAEDDTSYAVSKNGTAVTNQFDHADLNRVDTDTSNDVRYVSRNDWAGTMPQATISDSAYQAAVQIAANDGLVEGLTRGYVPDTSKTYQKSSFGVKRSKPLSLIQFMDTPLDGSIEIDGTKYTWDDLIDQIPYAQLARLIGQGFHQTSAISAIGKPATKDENGAQGFTATLTGGNSAVSYPSEDLRAATFNHELYEKTGVSLGNSAFFFGKKPYNGLYGPNANIHRTPYGGRNFEYYSEDPVLSGYALAGEAKGIQSKGVYVYMKHFALNDQETGRDGISVWANEQAIRQLYLKPFQMAIEDSDAHCVMTSFNRIGTRWAGADEHLLLNVLKGEFGMDGMAITDYSNNSYMGVAQGLQAGSDIWDCSAEKWQQVLVNDYANDSEMHYYMRRAAKNILYTVLHSNAMNGISADTTVIETLPWWKPTLIAIDVAFGAATVTFGTLLVVDIVKSKKTKKKPEEN